MNPTTITSRENPGIRLYSAEDVTTTVEVEVVPENGSETETVPRLNVELELAIVGIDPVTEFKAPPCASSANMLSL